MEVITVKYQNRDVGAVSFVSSTGFAASNNISIQT